jgi:hypothetical protein
MATEHERWVVGMMDGLSQSQRDRLVELLGVLKEHLARRAAQRAGNGKGADR